MSRTEFIKEVANAAGASQTLTEKIYDEIFYRIGKLLSESKAGVYFHIRGFGTFRVVKKRAITRKDPTTGALITIPEKEVIKFIPDKKIRPNTNKGGKR